ncbi:protein kinase [Candidatus Eisenbacteria bacterium]|uniref:Protein kinase n=1 Tax=Eiseniibacteriota bacterium TaxID=2212470 RepID=A0ABV6YIT2_UNCEI
MDSSRLRAFVLSLAKLCPAEREAALQQKHADDPALASAAEKLLKHDEDNAARDSELAPTVGFLMEGSSERPLNVMRQGNGSGRWGPLELLEKVGEGAFGETFRARDPRLERMVALKILRTPSSIGPGSTEAPESREVIREGVLLARVRHPNVAAVYGAEEHEGRAGLWMEYIEGQTLEALLRSQGRFGERETVGIGLDLSRALAVVHGVGIVHRDLKTQNVMREEGGRIVLMDFGVGLDLQKERETARGLVGTLPYMAPELLLGEPATVRSDIYSLGILLYRILTGDFPIESDSVKELRASLKAGRSGRLRDARPDLSGEFTYVIDRCLSLQPKDRFETAGELESVLMRLAGSPRTRAKEGATEAGSDLPTSSSTNLPRLPSTFVGRGRELAAVQQLVEHNILVTLTGSGGCGKTRLALEVARQMMSHFPDGVWLVDLAPVNSETLVPSSVALALSVKEVPQRSVSETLVDLLEQKDLLLVLDNCEHLLEGTARLVNQLLRACPRFRILSTSREALAITGEMTYRVPPLSIPDSSDRASLLEIGEAEAVHLFIDRAQGVNAGFRLTEQNAMDVVRVCRRLDGIPLAIELAAARVKAMGVAEIASRLDDRFRLLTSKARTGSSRHRTLHATIDWSHELLSDQERILFRRLSVFAGGCTLDALEVVCAGNGIENREVLDLIAHLVDKSLVYLDMERSQRTGQSRYRMLETIRLFAGDRLASSGEAVGIKRGYRHHYATFSERSERELHGPDQVRWLCLLDSEHDNMVSALRPVAHEAEDVGPQLRLASALGKYWSVRGHFQMALEHYEELLSEPKAQLRTEARARALYWASHMAMWLELPRSRQLAEESLAISRELGNEKLIAAALGRLGVVIYEQLETGGEGSVDVAKSHLETSLRISRERGDPLCASYALDHLAMIAHAMGDMSTAKTYVEDSLKVSRELGNLGAMGESLGELAQAAHRSGDEDRAKRLAGESLSIARKLGDRMAIVFALSVLARSEDATKDSDRLWSYYEEILDNLRNLPGISLHPILTVLKKQAALAQGRGEFNRAHDLITEHLRISQRMGDTSGIASSLLAFSVLARRRNMPGPAARLLATFQALCEESGDGVDFADRETVCKEIDCLRSLLGEQAFAEKSGIGRTMTMEEAIDYGVCSTNAKDGQES